MLTAVAQLQSDHDLIINKDLFGLVGVQNQVVVQTQGCQVLISSL